jgi:hypothetical protein
MQVNADTRDITEWVALHSADDVQLRVHVGRRVWGLVVIKAESRSNRDKVLFERKSC